MQQSGIHTIPALQVPQHASTSLMQHLRRKLAQTFRCLIASTLRLRHSIDPRNHPPTFPASIVRLGVVLFLSTLFISSQVSLNFARSLPVMLAVFQHVRNLVLLHSKRRCAILCLKLFHNTLGSSSVSCRSLSLRLYLWSWASLSRLLFALSLATSFSFVTCTEARRSARCSSES